jgi:hypothetical protein
LEIEQSSLVFTPQQQMMITQDLCTYGQDTNKITSSNGPHLIESYNSSFQIKKTQNFRKLREPIKHRIQVLEN